ncbi:NAD(P)/FAD-dependent oxidoreductase [Carnimonas nigrificans]|uniref:NAD(P)/FAD-dependent oxidoreductase n=1 Tax=Carnimonas nigrificans TaxID=64323 RepID=UPI000471A69D|nr:FAD-binding oxidoreductase [Carnimonas nigrificans]
MSVLHFRSSIDKKKLADPTSENARGRPLNYATTTRHSHRVSALPQDDKTPGWFYTSRTRIAMPTPEQDLKAPWVVLGAGFTGLSAARQLAHNFPDDRILLIDAQEVGFGASGRNAGFLIDVPHDISAPDYIGDHRIAAHTLALNRKGQMMLKALVEEHQLADAQLQHAGKYQAAASAKGNAVLKAYQGGLERLGQPCQMIEGAELGQLLGTNYYQKALYTPGTMLVQPSALVKGLADTLPDNVELFENTPITAVEYGPYITLHHPHGTITAKQLILANNTFGTHFGLLPKTLVPLFTYGSLTRPLSATEQSEIGALSSWGVIPADPFGTTLRLTPDHRILVRNSFSFNPNGAAKSGYNERFLAVHRRSFEQRFPQLSTVDFEYTWGGCLGMTRNGSGYFGQLGPNVYGALGCNGLGTVRGTATGALLADWLAGKQDTLIDFLMGSTPPPRLPHEPLLSFGINTALWWGQLKAGAEI